MGAILLAAIYHTSLYFFRRSRYLLFYTIYLCICACSLIFESAFVDISKNDSSLKFLVSNILRIATYQAYIIFVIDAIIQPIKKKLPGTWKIYLSTFLFNGLYLLSVFIIVAFFPRHQNLKFICFTVSNAYLLLVGTYLVVILLKFYQDRFAHAVAIGSAAMMVFSIFSVFARYLHGELPALAMACAGYFVQILFFSVAIGFRLREDEFSLLTSANQIKKQEKMLKQSEFERQIEIFIAKMIERRRISRDIHDGITNDLLGMKFHIQNLIKQDKKAGRQTDNLAALEIDISTIYDDSRKFMHHLFSEGEGTDYNLPQYIATLAEKLRESGLNIDIDVEPEITSRLSIFQKNNVYLIVKESLSNVLKHSQASCASVVIQFLEDECKLTIVDNGNGLKKNLTYGLGLRSMEERAKTIDGQLQLNSDDNGTCVVLIFPIHVDKYTI